MELRLTVFFALAAVALTGNAAILWAIWHAFRQAARRAEANRTQYARLTSALVDSLKTLEQGTTQLAVRSGEVRDAVVGIDNNLGRADNWARYGLAKLDFNADRVAQKLGSKTRHVAGGLREPLYKTAAAVHAVKAILELVAWERPGSRRVKKVSRMLEPLDTAATIVQAITALGALFAPRPWSRDVNAHDDATRR
jgi:hypothetical protein